MGGKKRGAKNKVKKVDEEEVLLNELIKQEKESDDEDFKSEEGDHVPNEFQKLVE